MESNTLSDLKNKINMLREELDKQLYIEKTINSEIIRLSEELDLLINEYNLMNYYNL